MLSDRTSPRRPRRLTPQVDALEDIISLTGISPPPSFVSVTSVDVKQSAAAAAIVSIEKADVDDVNAIAAVVQVASVRLQ